MINCLGNEVDSGCVIYNGPDIPSLGIVSGEAMDSVISKIAGMSQTQDSASANLTSDDIVSKSIIRNGTTFCSSKIVVRDFTYAISNSTSSTTFSYNLLNFAKALPQGYEVVSSRIRAIGSPNEKGSNIISDNKALSSGFGIGLNRYPVTVNITVRVQSDCGDIDFTKTVYLPSASTSGTFRALLDANDITNSLPGEIKLTDQLTKLETDVDVLRAQMSSNGIVVINGDEKDLSAEVATQKGEIESLQTTLSDPSTLKVNYNKDNQSRSAPIASAINDLYAEIELLRQEKRASDTEIASLKSQLNSLTSS